MGNEFNASVGVKATYDRLASKSLGLICSKLAIILGITCYASGCGHFVERPLEGESTPPPVTFFLPSDKTPCYLELEEGADALRVNCFDLDGILHIHSSRWSDLPRLSGESWTKTIRRNPEVRIEIDDKIYAMTGTLIDDEAKRRQILNDRGYWYAWEAISVFSFQARS